MALHLFTSCNLTTKVKSSSKQHRSIKLGIICKLIFLLPSVQRETLDYSDYKIRFLFSYPQQNTYISFIETPLFNLDIFGYFVCFIMDFNGKPSNLKIVFSSKWTEYFYLSNFSFCVCFKLCSVRFFLNTNWTWRISYHRKKINRNTFTMHLVQLP